MKNFPFILPRWIPALLMMSLIFWFSSQPAGRFPEVPGWDYVIRKTGHILEYGLLTLCFFFALQFEPKYRRTAWMLAILYAATDEFHQSFVPSRHPSVFDILIFDNIGAWVALGLHFTFWRKDEKQIPSR